MTSSQTSSPRVAIACQGGGSHTAFTAGVLDRLLSEENVDFEIVGLSGTSGGAICAFATWYGLASQNGPEGRKEARKFLTQIWGELSAENLFDAWMNAIGVGMVRMQSMGIPLPHFSPYDTPGSEWGREVLRTTLENAAPADTLAKLISDEERVLPRLDIGAVDVQRGTFKTFNERTISHDAIIASATVPNLFEAAPVTQPDGTTRWYWDGLFSENPPLGKLFGRDEGRLERADELWIIQINPHREEEIPTSLEAISDRRNELGGNISVNQELGFIRLLNEWEARGKLVDVYRPIEVKTINLDESLVSPNRPFDYPTKLDRSPRFLKQLWNHGQNQAEQFLAIERDRRCVHDAMNATWKGDLNTLRRERFLPTYELHLPTSLVQVVGDVEGKPIEDTTVIGLEGSTEFAKYIRDAISDLSYDIQETIAEPNKVATRWRLTGIHSGTLFDIEPTEQEVILSGMRIDHLDEGRLSEAWLLLEQWSLLRQLNVVETSTPVSTLRRVTPTPVVTQLSAPAENIEIARRDVTDVWNHGRLDALDQVFADDYTLYLDRGDNAQGRDSYWEFVQTYREAFPDLKLELEDTVSKGDKIVLRLRMRGTHSGEPVMGIKPTGRQISVSRMVLHHVSDGRITETGIAEDTMSLIQQLGVSPSRAI